MTISYHDYKEDFYHAFLAGIFAGAGYMVESNKEHGEGRSDVTVLDSRGGRAAVFEAKYVKTPDRMEEACHEALRQIEEKGYAREYESDNRKLYKIGAVFSSETGTIEEWIVG